MSSLDFKEKTMIGYFVGSGDVGVDEMFTPYLWGKEGFANKLKSLGQNNYGEGLKLLLIEYIVEGDFSGFFAVDKVRVRNYSSENKDISVVIPVKRIEFHECDDKRKREFIVRTTLNAIKLVQLRLVKRNLEINFGLLMSDVEKLGQDFIIGR